MGAFIFAHLKAISNSVDQTALAWEKRDYWVKADTFRRQWSWVEKPLQNLEEILNKRMARYPVCSGIWLASFLRQEPSEENGSPPWPGFWKKIFSKS